MLKGCNVVNCFQIVFLYRSLTTNNCNCGCIASLWIAFKLYFYIGLWQHTLRVSVNPIRCELLSNCIFISVFDNKLQRHCETSNVVNCFQIVFLYRSLTTYNWLERWKYLLWIAFKLYFYIGLWQHDRTNIYKLVCCELLSNCIFISVFDNS